MRLEVALFILSKDVSSCLETGETTKKLSKFSRLLDKNQTTDIVNVKQEF
jgi:hypothetical protein